MTQARSTIVPFAALSACYQDLEPAQQQVLLLQTLACELFSYEMLDEMSRIGGTGKLERATISKTTAALQAAARPSRPVDQSVLLFFGFRPDWAWFFFALETLKRHELFDDMVCHCLEKQVEVIALYRAEPDRLPPAQNWTYSLAATLYMTNSRKATALLPRLFDGDHPENHPRVAAFLAWQAALPQEETQKWQAATWVGLLPWLLRYLPPDPQNNQRLVTLAYAMLTRLDSQALYLPETAGLWGRVAMLALFSGRLPCNHGLLQSAPRDTRIWLHPLRSALAGRTYEVGEVLADLAGEASWLANFITRYGEPAAFLLLQLAWLRQAVGDDQAPFLKAALVYRSHHPFFGSLNQRILDGFLAPGKNLGQPWYEHQRYFERQAEPLHVWLYTFAVVWLSIPNPALDGETVKQAVTTLDNQGFWFAARDLAFLIAYQDQDEAAMDRLRAELAHRDLMPLMEMLPPREPWQLVLQELDTWRQRSSVAAPVEDSPQVSTRLIWVLHFDEAYGDQLEARFQKLHPTRRTWSKGRRVTCNQFVEKTREFEPLSQPDRRLLNFFLKRYHEGFYLLGRDLTQNFFVALEGHPHVYEKRDDGRLDAVEISAGKAHIQVVEERGKMVLQLVPSHSLPVAEDVLLTRDGSTRLVYVPVDDHLRGVRHILQRGVAVPLRAKDQLRRTLQDLAPLIQIQSDLELDDDAEEVAADSRLYLLLTPLSDVLSVQPAVKPLGENGPWFKPGSPGRSVTAEVKGRKLRTRRDHAAEEASLMRLFRICPSLFPFQQVAMPWVLDSLEDCLELLADLEAIRDEVITAWPEGRGMSLAGIAHLGNASLRIKHARDWFAVEGQVRVSEDMVLGLQEVLTLIGDGAIGRFVAVGQGRFLALSREFQRRLETLKTLNQGGDRGRLRYSLSAALSLAPLFEDVADFQADQRWEALQQRFEESRRLDIPIPPTLDATLRDYQISGFRWLARLAHCGFGACLADDMGLGKTVQAIAVLLRRAADGPALVLAPTSVCHNWEMEIRRFAPTLRPRSFGDDDRAKVVSELEAFDVLIVSHGLLPFVGDILQTRTWRSLVFDEAQAIKNFGTQRAKTARALAADFRMITTGTPIENHLGELWSLFHFLNPGLLGSRDSFNKRFAGPIERQSDRNVQRDLQLLVQPFILRRLKRDVLLELPPRTEIELQVTLNEEERALYEAIRRDAVERISRMSPGKGNQYLEVLANLMRLRRGVCHPKMVVPEWDQGSTKLRMLASILDELRANGHRALIFSQFVDHLKLIRDFMEQAGVSYQYLDGATPAAARAKRVRAFQGGEGDAFLISLKAGGTGLNLTAADYVILMDPWWNPAVEDQASDRAHRLGQTRPVTIYRLVAKDTVEEKIMSLHRHKRELAESLLEGTESGAPLDKDVLLRLLDVSA